MRAFILLASAALALGGCGKDTTGNTAAVDENFTSEDVVTNDATVIDAALSADANMAEDVEFNIVEFGNESGGDRDRNGSRDAPRPRIVSPDEAPTNTTDTPNSIEPAEPDPAED